MAALDTFISTADVGEVIASEDIADFIYSLERPLPIAMSIAWAQPARGVVPVVFPRWNEFSDEPAERAGGESDEFVDAEIDMDSSQIQAAFRGFKITTAHEVSKSTSFGVGAGVLVEALRLFDQLIDTDTLAVLSTATEDTGDVTDTYDFARFQADKLVFKAMHTPTDDVALVLTDVAYSQLETVILASGATLQPGSGLDFGPHPGYKGGYRGFQVFESYNLANETTGAAGAILPVGRAGGLGIAVDEMPNVRAEMTNRETRAIDAWVLRAMYGVGVTNPRRMLKLFIPR